MVIIYYGHHEYKVFLQSKKMPPGLAPAAYMK